LTGATAASEMQKPATTWQQAPAARSGWLKAAALVLIFVYYPLVTIRAPLVDPDIWWHIRTGEWIMAHHQVPRTDPFSITGAGKPWVAYSWTFELLVHAIARTWDLAGIAVLRILMWLAATGALYHLLRKLVPQFWRAAALTAVGSFVMVRAFGPRPGPLTVLFFILEFIILLQADRTGDTRKLWLLPLLLCAWSNVHVQFVYGLFVLGLFCLDPILSRWFRYQPEGEGKIPNGRLWLTLLVSTAATLVNPYGWGVYRVLLDYARQPLLAKYVGETNPLPFNQTSDYVAVLLALGAAFALGRSRRVRPLWLLSLVWAAVSAFRAQRDIWVLAVVACVVIAVYVRADLPMESLAPRVRLGAVACVIAILLLANQFIATTSKQHLSYVAVRLPLGSVSYIHQHHLQGPIFNNFDWGGFLIYALPGMPVAVDGRTNVHGQEELGRSFATWSGAPGWESDPLLAGANLVIASPGFPLTQLLRLDPRFQAVFDDGVSVVFQRRPLGVSSRESAR